MSISITIKVRPKSGVQHISLSKNRTIVVKLKKPAENYQANNELVTLLARTLGLPTESIIIVQGAQTPKKTLRIVGIDSQEELYRRLNLDYQEPLIKR